MSRNTSAKLLLANCTKFGTHHISSVVVVVPAPWSVSSYGPSQRTETKQNPGGKVLNTGDDLQSFKQKKKYKNRKKNREKIANPHLENFSVIFIFNFSVTYFNLF